MSATLDALNTLSADNVTAWFRLSQTSQAVLFYATKYWQERFNWVDKSVPTDEVSNSDWDTISAYVDGLLYEAKNPMIGYIIPFVTADPPAGVLPCDGSTYLRGDYPNLYAELDSFFIIDSDHFSVPDLRGRTVVGAGNGSGLSSRSVGSVGGEENHTLDEGEIPSHSHSIPATITSLVVAPGEITALTPIPLISGSTGSTGGSGSHNNMQPFYSLNYGIIAS